MSKVKDAVDLFKTGYGCAPAIAGAFCKEAGVTKEQALAMASCFGAGMCATRKTCGAVSAALMVMGLARGWTEAEQKAFAYSEGRKIFEDFEKEFGSTTCLDLLTVAKAKFSETPMARDEEYYRVRPCAVFIAYVAEWLGRYLDVTE